MKHLALTISLLMALPCVSLAYETGPRGGARFMEKHDADGDGKISKDEFMNQHEERFKKIDQDGDGYLTRDEVSDAGRRIRRERPTTPPRPRY